MTNKKQPTASLKQHREAHRSQTKIIITEPNGRVRVQTKINAKGKTQQHFRDHVNINNIIAKYKRTGMMPINPDTGVYGDFSEMPSYHEALNTVTLAEQSFLTLPAQTRLKFNNDPQKLMEFLDDPKNYEEAHKLGLIDQQKFAAYQEKIKPKTNITDPAASQPPKDPPK